MSRIQSPRPFKRTRRTVIVRFKDHIQIPYEDGAEKYLMAQKISGWEKILRIRKQSALRKIMINCDEKDIHALAQRAAKRIPGYMPPKLQNYFAIDCPSREKAEALVKELQTWTDSVQSAYVARPALGPEVDLNATVPNPLWKFQSHLESAPLGIGARDVWPQAGADGSGISVIDLEMGWTLDHQDFVRHLPQLIPGGVLIDYARPHGTKTLGVICGSGEPDRCVGIAPHLASVNVISYGNDETLINDCILTAAQRLSAGDVLVLEVHLDGTKLPCEAEPLNFDAIQLAVASGIVVIEAAGNGHSDFDQFNDSILGPRLNRGHGSFQDSGAILVAAGWIPPNVNARAWDRWPGSNYGSRIDCFASGQDVYTASTRETGGVPTWSINDYDFFAGTSSATAIIAGVALSVQGLARARNNTPFTPEALRSILSDPQNGTVSRQGRGVDKIGVMPDLNAISAVI